MCSYDEEQLKAKIAALPQQDEKDDPQVLRARTKAHRSYITWTEEEDQILSDLFCNAFSINKIAKLLCRSTGAIKARIDGLELSVNRDNTQEKWQLVVDDVNNASSTTRQLIDYWRNSLADSDKLGLSSQEMRRAKCFASELFKQGQLPPQDVEPFFIEADKNLRDQKKYKRKNKKNSSEDEEQEERVEKLEVIISPYTAVLSDKHGNKIHDNHKEVFPLWIEAELMRDGRLMPREKIQFPWIERRCLTPNEEIIGYLIIADVQDADKFYTLRQANLNRGGQITWQQLFQLADELLDEICKEDIEVVLLKQGYSLNRQGYILPFSEKQGACRSIIKTYDQYLHGRNRKIPPLLEKFCQLKERDYVADKSTDDLYDMNQYHLGQMLSDYPLSPSQRLSLNYFLDKQDDNRLFTVHGPPGTGKTTLLMSVIASAWVEAIINKKERPPIIVVSSTNNIAIQNVLDQFKKVDSVDQDFYQHWLPDFNHYGLYLCSNSIQRTEEANDRGYLYRNSNCSPLN